MHVRTTSAYVAPGKLDLCKEVVVVVENSSPGRGLSKSSSSFIEVPHSVDQITNWTELGRKSKKYFLQNDPRIVTPVNLHLPAIFTDVHLPQFDKVAIHCKN